MVMYINCYCLKNFKWQHTNTLVKYDFKVRNDLTAVFNYTRCLVTNSRLLLFALLLTLEFAEGVSPMKNSSNS